MFPANNFILIIPKKPINNNNDDVAISVEIINSRSLLLALKKKQIFNVKP